MSAPADDALAARARVLVLSAALQRARLANDWGALRAQTRPAALVHSLAPALVALAALVWAARRRSASSGDASMLANLFALARLGLLAARWWRGR